MSLGGKLFSPFLLGLSGQLIERIASVVTVRSLKSIGLPSLTARQARRSAVSERELRARWG